MAIRLLMGTSTLAINPGLQPTLTPKDPLRDLAPIGMVFRTAFVLHVHPEVPARTTAELIAWCRANPGKLNFGSSGTGAVNHLAQALFAQAGRDRGDACALQGRRAGACSTCAPAASRRCSRRCWKRCPACGTAPPGASGISSAERAALLPDLPPVADALPGFDVVFWQGLFAPAATPRPGAGAAGHGAGRRDRDPDLRARMAEHGVVITTGDAAALHHTLATETTMWGKLIRDAGIRPD